ncbi:MAG: hypothetical protein JSS00_11190 [Proteobacteria bacterium]|nr:hypothetical protein [Pseudomonadota bacterium]
MRANALIGALMLAACATGTSLTPPQRLAGCWINRDAGAARMRWSEGAGGGLVGVKTLFGIAGVNTTERYALAATDGGWRLCRVDAGSRCWNVALGEGGSLTGGRAFIDGGSDYMRIAVIGDGPERVIFQGRREACRN